MTDEKKPKLRRVFPERAAERVSVSARTTVKVRDRLEAAAREEGRSVSQEVERRLAESLWADDMVAHAAQIAREREVPIIDGLGGPETYSLLQDIAGLIGGVEADQGKRWFESADLRAQLFKVLEAAMPELLRMERGPRQPHEFLRAVDLAKYLPERPKKPRPEMPKGARFMTDEELKEFFYLNDDNA